MDTAMLAAARSGDAGEIRRLVAGGADVEETCHTTTHALRPLERATALLRRWVRWGWSTQGT
jgi:hypothetical protein